MNSPKELAAFRDKHPEVSRFDLALLALQVLDAQKRYFKTRSKDDLIASKQLEAELRRKAEAVLEESRVPE